MFVGALSSLRDALSWVETEKKIVDNPDAVSYSRSGQVSFDVEGHLAPIHKEATMRYLMIALFALTACATDSLSEPTEMVDNASVTNDAPKCDDNDPSTTDVWYKGHANGAQCIYGKNATVGSFNQRLAAAKQGDFLADAEGRCLEERSWCEANSANLYRIFKPEILNWVSVAEWQGKNTFTCLGNSKKPYRFEACKAGMCQQSGPTTTKCTQFATNAPMKVLCVAVPTEYDTNMTLQSCNFSDNTAECTKGAYVSWQKSALDPLKGARWCTVVANDVAHTQIQFVTSKLDQIFNMNFTLVTGSTVASEETKHYQMLGGMVDCPMQNGNALAPFTKALCAVAKQGTVILNW